MTAVVKTPLIDIIAGARPNFMKIAPILRALQLRQAAGGRLRYRLIHMGQHYDARMSGDFFEQLGIPKPDVNLEVGSGTQAEQTAAIMVRYEKLLLEQRSDLCLVVSPPPWPARLWRKDFAYRWHMWRGASVPETGRCRKKSIGW